MTNNLLLKDNKLISSSDVLYKWTGGNKLARAYSTGVWDKPEVGGRLSEIGLYPRVFDTYKWLVENGLYDKLVFGINRQAGFLPNEITGADHLHTAYDLSKYKNDAEQTTPANQPKVVSKGFEFISDNNTRLEVPHSDELAGFEEASWVWWVNRKSLADTLTGVIEKQGTSASGNLGYALREISLGRFNLFNSSNGEVGSSVTTITENIMEDNIWINIGIIFNKGDWHIYKNGNFVETLVSDDKSVHNNTGRYLTVGAYRVAANWYNGTVNDLLKFTGIVLNPTQITSYYNETQKFYK